MMPDHSDDTPPAASADPSEEHLPLVELETLPARPPSRRKRLAQISLVLVVAVVALVAFHGVLFPHHPLSQPTPALHLPGTISPALLIQSDVTYGTVTINGHKQSVSPPLVTALQGQTYDLTLTAPPFRPVSCHVISPPPPASGALPAISQQGHCRVARHGSTANLPIIHLHDIFAYPSLIIEIDVTAADLSPEQQRQVMTLLTTPALTTQQEISVPPGEFIATNVTPDGTITSTRTSEPLEARAFLAPSTSFFPQETFCRAITCPVGLSPDMSSSTSAFPTSPLWAVGVPMGLSWQFTRASGDMAAEVSFPAGSLIEVFLSYDAKQGWQMAQQTLVPGYGSIADQLPTTFCSEGSYLLYLQLGQPARSYPNILNDQVIVGCAMSLEQIDSNQPQNTTDLGHFVWRFGVLLAADDKAHALAPDLPMASSEEIAAVGG